MVATCGLCYTAFSNIVYIATLAIFVLINGCFQSIANAASKSIIWHLVPRYYAPVAIPISSVTFNLAGIIGPAIAGYVLSKNGVEQVFYISASLKLVFFSTLLFIKLGDDVKRRNSCKGQRFSIFDELRNGFDYVTHDRAIGHFLLLHIAFCFFAQPVIDMLPALVSIKIEGGAQELGHDMAALGAGSILGGVWLGSYARIRNFGAILISASAFLIFSVILLAYSSNLFLSFAVCFAIGFSITVRTSATQSLVQMSVSPKFRGRVMGFYSLVDRTGKAFGALFIGIAGDGVGVSGAFIGSAILTACFLLWISPRILKYGSLSVYGSKTHPYLKS
jgi:predicted MFS family arabinose efflux permease